MGMKEICTYVCFVIGLVMVCAGKVIFQQRQRTTPDNAYSSMEKKLVHGGYVVLAVAFILACIPIYD